MTNIASFSNRTVFFILLLLSTSYAVLAQEILTSPDKNLVMRFEVNGDGIASYQLSYKGKPVIHPSQLGLEVKDKASFLTGFNVATTTRGAVDTAWTPVWGEEKTIRNNYQELAVTLEQKAEKNRRMIIRFRLFNDGLGFRYEFPKQPELHYFIISEERTEFNLAGDRSSNSAGQG